MARWLIDGAANAEGLDAAMGAGTLVLVPVCVPAGVLTSGFGKKVALCPLWICHWSHNKTIEKPKMTHKIVRRMSFMKWSFLFVLSWHETQKGRGIAQGPGPSRHRTKGDTGQDA